MTDDLKNYMEHSCCTNQECERWSVEACVACRTKMIAENDKMVRDAIIDEIRPILENLEGTFFWYQEVSKKLDELKEKNNGKILL